MIQSHIDSGADVTVAYNEQEIPESLYQAIVEIYVYFLRFDPSGQGEKKQNGVTPEQP